jgi:hypothetical protein
MLLVASEVDLFALRQTGDGNDGAQCAAEGQHSVLSLFSLFLIRSFAFTYTCLPPSPHTSIRAILAHALVIVINMTPSVAGADIKGNAIEGESGHRILLEGVQTPVRRRRDRGSRFWHSIRPLGTVHHIAGTRTSTGLKGNLFEGESGHRVLL